MQVSIMSLFFLMTISSSTCIFVCLSFPQYATAATLEKQTDKLALLEFKSQITEDPLGVLSSWNDSLHFCNWTGVICSLENQRLLSLNLTSKKLAGTISPSLGNLSLVNVLDFSANFFRGSVPSELGNLGRLQNLNLSNNLLSGEIPAKLSNCSRLTSMALDHNHLVGMVPPEFGSFLNLENLYVGSNNLTGTVPASLGNLTSLLQLDMSYNNLKGEIPFTLSKLMNLKTFRLSVNNLSGEFPPMLYNLTSLEFISLSFNNFTGNMRKDIGLAFPALQKLWLAYNFLTGPIPESFSNASNLQNIDLLNNRLTGKVPSSLGKLDFQRFSIGFNNLGSNETDDLNFITALTNCSNLEFLHFGGNHFGGLLPVSIGNLSTKMTQLYMQGGGIHGTIPKEISKLVNLNILYMSFNNLSGNIPNSIGMLPNLGKLVLGSNQLTGKIPSSLGNNTRLLWLFLFGNRLEGEIPSLLANCSQLVFLYMPENNLTGTIPREIMSIPSLLSFNVSYNSLSGPFPENVGNLSSVVEIDLSHNKFSGDIPGSLGNCLALNILSLQGNLFQGTIPYLDKLQNLQYIDLSSNNLSGKIPNFFMNLQSILYLNLSFNNLEGEVPITGVFSNSSAVDLHGNPKLCGGMQQLQLQPCLNKETEKRDEKHSISWKLIVVIVIIIASVGVLSLLVLLLICRRKRLKTQPETMSTPLNFFPKISYEELLNATDGFSSQKLIGSGGFGTVYKGSLVSVGATVAVKVLNLQKKGASRSFMAECQVLRNIRHHNLVKIITACSSTDFSGNDFKALVYQFMSNSNLDKWLHPEKKTKGNTLNIIQRLNITMDVASALCYLHHQCQNPVIHCDLKPQNVLLDDDLTAHVGDFGLARLLPKFKNQFSSLGIKGTIGYAPPEYGMGMQTTTLGDVYSFGILLLEIFTGKRPTEKIFQDNLNLHQFVKRALPDRPMEVLDDSALCEDIAGTASTWDEGWTNLTSKQQECLKHILRIGVICSAEFPPNRMNMRQVQRELSIIRDSFLGIDEEKQPSSSVVD